MIPCKKMLLPINKLDFTKSKCSLWDTVSGTGTVSGTQYLII